MERDVAILWRRLDQPGHDSARLVAARGGWELSGVAVFADEGRACRLDYRIECDGAWRTRAARIEGWIGAQDVALALDVDAEQRWRLDGRECAEVAGCLDVDLQFTPATNLLPIRRLALANGASADVRAAWLRFPELVLAPLSQRYERLAGDRYRYESGGGRFVRELEVTPTGFVTLYPDFWVAESS